MNPRLLLAPLTPLYRFGLVLRERALRTGAERIQGLQLPVISIGNLSTGGTGKTPLAIRLAQALMARGIGVDVLSRGYGRRSRSAKRVDPAGSTEEYGDEPLLIARLAGVPVFVAPERCDAGLLAETGMKAQGTHVHILDDGFQHRQLHRDVDILLVSREELSDRLLPGGNLREPLSAMQRASVVAIPANDPALESDLRERGLRAPIWRLHRRMEIPPLEGPVLGFCGIARPAQFFWGLEAASVSLVGRRAFPDHHRYSQADFNLLNAQARAAGAEALVTTEKDAVRLREFQISLPVRTVALRIEIEDERAGVDWLLAQIAEA
jgi:tetraacyldisaccharide 4'-kinase